MQAAWREVVRLLPRGVAMAPDALLVEMLAALYAEFREDPMGFQTTKHAELRRMLGAFGMTPADRSKVTAPRDDRNPFEGL